MYLFEKTSYCPCQRTFEGFGWKILMVAPCCQGLATNIHFPRGTSHHPSELLPNPPRRELLNHLPSDTLGSNGETMGNVFPIYRRLVPAELGNPHAARGNPAAKGFSSPDVLLQHEVTAGPTKLQKNPSKARRWCKYMLYLGSLFYF